MAPAPLREPLLSSALVVRGVPTSSRVIRSREWMRPDMTIERIEVLEVFRENRSLPPVRVGDSIDRFIYTAEADQPTSGLDFLSRPNVEGVYFLVPHHDRTPAGSHVAWIATFLDGGAHRISRFESVIAQNTSYGDPPIALAGAAYGRRLLADSREDVVYLPPRNEAAGKDTHPVTEGLALSQGMRWSDFLSWLRETAESQVESP